MPTKLACKIIVNEIHNELCLKVKNKIGTSSIMLTQNIQRDQKLSNSSANLIQLPRSLRLTTVAYCFPVGHIGRASALWRSESRS